MNWENFGSETAAIQKSKFSIFFMNCKKLGSIHSPRPTFQNLNFEYLWMNWESLCHKLRFTVENKMRNLPQKMMVIF